MYGATSLAAQGSRLFRNKCELGLIWFLVEDVAKSIERYGKTEARLDQAAWPRVSPVSFRAGLTMARR